MVKIQSSVLRGVFELSDAAGNNEKRIPYNINLTKVNIQQLDLMRQELSIAHKDNDLERMGRIVSELFEEVLGEETVAELADYYQGDFVAMLADLAPFITDEVFPALDRTNKKLAAGHKGVKR